MKRMTNRDNASASEAMEAAAVELCIIRIEMNAQAEGRHDPGNICCVKDI